jgi:hypothetical protein
MRGHVIRPTIEVDQAMISRTKHEHAMLKPENQKDKQRFEKLSHSRARDRRRDHPRGQDIQSRQGPA